MAINDILSLSTDHVAPTTMHSQTSTTSRLSFADYTDLQTRLVLLPRVEEEGIGAVVASYRSSDEITTTKAVIEPLSEGERGSFNESSPSSLSMVGYVVTRINESDNNCDLLCPLEDQAFSDILATIRKANTPIVLTFELLSPDDDDENQKGELVVDTAAAARENDNNVEEPRPRLDIVEEKKSEDDSDLESPKTSREEEYTSAAEDEYDEDIGSFFTPTAAEVNAQDFCTPESAASSETATPTTGTASHTAVTTSINSFNLSVWTSRVSAAATAAATSAAAMAKAANEHAKQASAARAAAHVIARTAPPETSSSAPELAIFVQSETGAFLPVPDKDISTSSSYTTDSATAVAAVRPTNASLLIVRVSALQSAPGDCQFQWYRSSSDTDNNNGDWKLLHGANNAAFQPSATEIGYRLRCMVTTSTISSSDCDAEGNDSSPDENSATTTTATVKCETAQTVAAALPLFNGARQALVRGAQFSGLLGRGNAECRTFCVKIEMSYETERTKRNKRKQPRVVCAVTIYQVSGSTSEPLHPENEPIRCVTAAADCGHAKNLELILPSQLPESASMVAALCADGSRFLLQAPNRLARESLLLTIGIANYKGKPVDLDAVTILYPDRSILSADDDDGSSAASSTGDDNLSIQSSSSSSSAGDQLAWPQHITSERPPLAVRRQVSTEPRGCLQRSASLDGVQSSADTAAMHELQQELQQLRSKLTRKDKIISELQRQVAHSDETLRRTEQKLSSTESEVQQSQAENRSIQQNLSATEKQVVDRDQTIEQLKCEFQARNEALESDIQVQNSKIAALEKANRTLQNEKDVLGAAVEAREVKLTKMAGLQASFAIVSAKAAKQKEFQEELDEANKRCAVAKAEVSRIQESNREWQEKFSQAQAQITALEQQLHVEILKTAAHQSGFEKEQMKVQKLKAERNSYKQKGDSLAKEMNRICRNGRTVREVEKILADDVTRREETNLLREQKRKALEQVEHFRTAYEQSLSVQKLAGLDHDAGKLLERNAELERLLSDLAEYLNAKEMQLETMKQVNDALQAEIRDLAKANMSRNDI